MKHSNKALLPPEPLYFKEYGSGPPLLLLHGLMVTGEMFEPIIEPLAHQYHLIVPDLRGHGASRNLPPPYTAVHMASDLDRLLGHLGIESAAVLGDSMGGAVAQQLALDYPRRCERLVLASTYTHNLTSVAEKLGGRLFPFLLRVLGLRRSARFIFSFGTRQVSKKYADWLTGIIAAQDLKVMLSALRENVIKFDSRRRLGEVKCPTIIIAGSLDKGDVRQANMLHEGIKGSEMVIVDNADHALLWAHTSEFLSIVEEFLKGYRR